MRFWEIKEAMTDTDVGLEPETPAPTNVMQTVDGEETTDDTVAPPEADDKIISQGPPYPREQFDAVRKFQRELEKIGYSVGRTGVDGKYGPRTERAVQAFRKDYNVPGGPGSVDNKFLDKLGKVEAGQIPKVATPSDTGNPKPFGGQELQALSFGGEKNAEAKAAAEEFLGNEMSDQEWNALVRATVAEASPNAREQAAVMAVILNRARSSEYPDGIVAVLTQRNQFQAVTGTRFDPGPSRNFSNPSETAIASVADAALNHLKDMDKSWLNFTSNNPRAYGRGTNINFMYAMRDAPDSQVIGQTVFGTA